MVEGRQHVEDMRELINLDHERGRGRGRGRAPAPAPAPAPDPWADSLLQWKR